MSKEVDERVMYQLNDDNSNSSVTIPAGALESIACFATLGVDGVYSVGGNIKKDNVSKVSDSGVSGIKVQVDDKNATVFISIEMKYGFNIPALSEDIQDKVKTTIENMTDFKVQTVNIKITDIIFK